MSNAPRPKHYKVIYADPPWTFATYSRKGKGRSPEAYYDCMNLADIKALPVAEWAADDCVLLQVAGELAVVILDPVKRMVDQVVIVAVVGPVEVGRR